MIDYLIHHAFLVFALWGCTAALCVAITWIYVLDVTTRLLLLTAQLLRKAFEEDGTSPIAVAPAAAAVHETKTVSHQYHNAKPHDMVEGQSADVAENLSQARLQGTVPLPQGSTVQSKHEEIDPFIDTHEVISDGQCGRKTFDDVAVQTRVAQNDSDDLEESEDSWSEQFLDLTADDPPQYTGVEWTMPAPGPISGLQMEMVCESQAPVTRQSALQAPSVNASMCDSGAVAFVNSSRFLVGQSPDGRQHGPQQRSDVRDTRPTIYSAEQLAEARSFKKEVTLAKEAVVRKYKTNSAGHVRNTPPVKNQRTTTRPAHARVSVTRQTFNKPSIELKRVILAPPTSAVGSLHSLPPRLRYAQAKRAANMQDEHPSQDIKSKSELLHATRVEEPGDAISPPDQHFEGSAQATRPHTEAVSEPRIDTSNPTSLPVEAMMALNTSPSRPKHCDIDGFSCLQCRRWSALFPPPEHEHDGLCVPCRTVQGRLEDAQRLIAPDQFHEHCTSQRHSSMLRDVTCAKCVHCDDSRGKMCTSCGRHYAGDCATMNAPDIEECLDGEVTTTDDEVASSQSTVVVTTVDGRVPANGGQYNLLDLSFSPPKLDTTAATPALRPSKANLTSRLPPLPASLSRSASLCASSTTPQSTSKRRESSLEPNALPFFAPSSGSSILEQSPSDANEPEEAYAFLQASAGSDVPDWTTSLTSYPGYELDICAPSWGYEHQIQTTSPVLPNVADQYVGSNDFTCSNTESKSGFLPTSGGPFSPGSENTLPSAPPLRRLSQAVSIKLPPPKLTQPAPIDVSSKEDFPAPQNARSDTVSLPLRRGIPIAAPSFPPGLRQLSRSHQSDFDAILGSTSSQAKEHPVDDGAKTKPTTTKPSNKVVAPPAPDTEKDTAGEAEIFLRFKAFAEPGRANEIMSNQVTKEQSESSSTSSDDTESGDDDARYRFTPIVRADERKLVHSGAAVPSLGQGGSLAYDAQSITTYKYKNEVRKRYNTGWHDVFKDASRSISEATQDLGSADRTASHLHAEEMHVSTNAEMGVDVPRASQQKPRKVARDALFQAWCLRELARRQALSTPTIEFMSSLEKATADYLDKRITLQQCMASGRLNDEDAAVYPMLPASDLAQPKRWPPGAKDVVEELKAKQKSGDRTIPDESTASPAEPSPLTEIDTLRQKAKDALRRYNECAASMKGPLPEGRASSRDKKDKAEAATKRALKFYCIKLTALRAVSPEDEWIGNELPVL